MTSEKPFSVIEEAILDHLATYQFLTHKQLMALGVNNDPKRVYAGLASLRARRPKIVFHIEFGTNPRDGNLAAMYALTPRGAELIVERYRGAITVPAHKRVDTFKNDYWHRLWCVDFHITVRHWAAANDQSVGLFETYYDPTTGGGRGKKLEKKTRIPYQGRWFEPDAIFQMIDRAGKSRLFVYELYVGIRTKRVEEQLKAHLTAMGEEAAEAAYGATSSARHLIVFDDQHSLDLARDRIGQHPWFQDANELFFLSTRPAVAEDFLGNWQRIDGEVVTLF